MCAKKDELENKVVIDNLFDLIKAPTHSWVNINGNKEFKLSSQRKGLRRAITLSLEEKYVCKNRYDIFLQSLTPVYVEKFLKTAGKGASYLKIIEKGVVEDA